MEVKSSTDSSRASLIREESSAYSETTKSPNAGQKPPDSNNTIGSAAAWTSRGELVQGRNECVGELKRGTRGLTGVAHCERTPVSAVKVWGGVCATPQRVYECSGSGLSLNRL